MQVSNTLTVNIIFCQKQILGDLKTYLAIEESQTNTLDTWQIIDMSTKRHADSSRNHADIMQTYDLLIFDITRSNGSIFSLQNNTKCPA